RAGGTGGTHRLVEGELRGDAGSPGNVVQISQAVMAVPVAIKGRDDQAHLLPRVSAQIDGLLGPGYEAPIRIGCLADGASRVVARPCARSRSLEQPRPHDISPSIAQAGD